jgi:Family of unknown function (DUF6152)
VLDCASLDMIATPMVRSDGSNKANKPCGEALAAKYKPLLILFIGLLIASQPLLAHHGVAAYDYKTTVTANKVTVTQFEWMNPHCKILFDVTDEKHNVEHWAVEMHPPADMMEHGWTRQTLSTGDVITLSFRPAKDGSTTGLLESMVLPNGIELHQNLLLLPPGEKLSIQQWERRKHVPS